MRAPLPGALAHAVLFRADPVTGERTEATNILEVEPGCLVISVGHQVRAEER